MPRLLVALGANLGDAENTFERVLFLMPHHHLQVLAVSRLYTSAPWPKKIAHQPLYTNAVCLVRSDLGPWAVLRRLKKIEQLLGRRPSKHPWQPRIIDLDLVAYQRVSMTSKNLTLPHPRAHLRRFVVEPVVDVAPDWCLDTSRQTDARSLLIAMNGENGDILSIKAWRLCN